MQRASKAIHYSFRILSNLMGENAISSSTVMMHRELTSTIGSRYSR